MPWQKLSQFFFFYTGTMYRKSIGQNILLDLVLSPFHIDVKCYWCLLHLLLSQRYHQRNWEIKKHAYKTSFYQSKKVSKNFIYEISTTFNQCLIICRDNGITIQITSYQVCTELIIFLGLLIFGFLPFEKNMVVVEIVKVFSNFVIFSVQPLYYLNGDVNFRKRVQNQGLWKALKRELFQTNSHIQPVSWFIPIYIDVLYK